MLTEILVSLAVATIAWFYVQRKKLQGCTNTNLPPGPWGLPILGHLPFFGSNPCVTFLKWKNIYGPIFSIKFAATPVVVLNDLKSIKEAFNLDAMCGRPHLPNFLKISDNSKGIGCFDGPNSEQRKFTIKSFKETGLGNSEFEYRLKEEITKFLSSLKSQCRATPKMQPMDIHHFFQFPVINSIWVAILGKRFEENDPTLTKFMEVFDRFIDTNSTTFAQLSWFFPPVSNVLSFLGLNQAVTEFGKIYDYIYSQVKQCREDHVPGQPKHFTHAYFDRVDQTKDPQSSFYKGMEQRITTGDIFLAAAETTTSTLDWLLLYMAREPDVQRQLQAEIDDVLGTQDSSKIPSFEDASSMPYTAAVIHEVLRISSVTPLGVFHRTMQDVNIGGYAIPKDTLISANIYGVHHDPVTWTDPDTFNPQRFLDSNGKLNKASADLIPFSFGKRNCIGEGFARNQLFLTCTSFFQAFSVSCTEKKPSSEGKFGLSYASHKFQLYVTERQF